MPTLKAFAQRFIDGHARANRQKPSGIAAKEMLLRVHLVPFLGHKRLNAVTSEDVQRFKRSLIVKAPKAALDAAIQLLDSRGHAGRRGNIVATATASAGEVRKG